MSWREVKLVIYVSEWLRYLSIRCEPGQSMWVLDQGPIYALGRLEAVGKPFTTSAAYRRWHQRMVEAWSGKLSRIVFLDAPDPVLVKRIGGRSQDHETKGQSPDVSYEFLGRHRRAFNRTVIAVELAGGPEAQRIDTGAASPGQVEAEVAARLERPPG
jgi:hypothetical protein